MWGRKATPSSAVTQIFAFPLSFLGRNWSNQIPQKNTWKLSLWHKNKSRKAFMCLLLTKESRLTDLSPRPEAGAWFGFVSVYFTVSLFIQLLPSPGGSQGSTGRQLHPKPTSSPWSWQPLHAALWNTDSRVLVNLEKASSLPQRKR